MNIEQIKVLAIKNQKVIVEYDTIAEYYFAWNKLREEDVERLQYMGEVENAMQNNFPFPTSISYWSKDYPIHFSYYPYHSCEVYKKKDCPSYYLIYTEFGGHTPERRCRLLRTEIIH